METWHKKKLDEANATDYFTVLLERGNIITISQDNLLLGYVEFWRLNYGQFGRIVCCEEFSAIQEDVQTGNIAYVANTFIRKEYRKGEVYKMLRDRFFEANKACDYFVGEARRKKVGLIKVFKRDKILERI